MNCADIERAELMERYVAGALAGDERDQLEEHYFRCEEAFDKLRASRAAQNAMRKNEQSIRADNRVRAFPRLLWPAVAMAAALFIAFVALHQNSPAPRVVPAA